MTTASRGQALGSAWRPSDLHMLMQYDWDVLQTSNAGQDRCRDAEEALHAIAYALLAKDAEALAALRRTAVALMKTRHEHLGAVWNEHLRRHERGPYGVVAGGPVHSSHAQTQEIDAIIARVQRALRSADQRRQSGKPPALEAVAPDVAMHVIANIATQDAPTLYRLVPGREAAHPQRHVMLRKEAATRAVRAVLDRNERSSWPSKEVAVKIVGAVLRALAIPSSAVKTALDSVAKRVRRRSGGQKK